MTSSGFTSSGYPVLTLSDVIERAIDKTMAPTDDARTRRFLERAARDSLRDLASMSNWAYYTRDIRFTTRASETATVSYDSSTGQVTRTDGGQWQSYHAGGQVIINGVPYDVDQYVSTSVITVSAPNDYTGDVTWVQSKYSIPSVSQIYDFWAISNRRPIQYIPPAELYNIKISTVFPGTPYAFTILRGDTEWEVEVELYHPPSQAEEFSILASVTPQYPKISQVIDNVSGASGSTFTAPLAKQSWVGSVVRTSTEGASIEDLKHGVYDWQAEIMDVTSTTVTVDRPVPSGWSGGEILVSSKIDINVLTMQSFFESLVYAYYARNFHVEALPLAEAEVRRLFIEARGADGIMNQTTRRGRSVGNWPFDRIVYAEVER